MKRTRGAGKLKRDVGLVGLTFVSVSGMLGSGWLFAPLLVSQEAGPAAVVAWLIGGSLILLVALTFAEVSSLLPIAGGIARLPHFCYGNVVSMVMGFTAWVGYASNAPIATLILMEYAAHNIPWIYRGDISNKELSLGGMAVAGGILLVMVLINVVGVRALAACNTALTWAKLIIPLVIGGALVAAHFDIGNFTARGGFAPFGIGGILTAIATGGVIFAFTGFRHAIDLAGETRNPKVTIPLALTLSVVICTLLYGFVQVAFIGALDADQLSQGWGHLDLNHGLGPIAAVAAALGLVWAGVVIYGGAIIAPFGGGLVSTGSNARLTLALARNGFFLPFFDALSRSGVPLRGLIVNYAVSLFMVLVIPFQELITLNVATIVLSFSVGPLSVYCFREQLADRARGYSVPWVAVTAPTAFVGSVLILYWAGWDTMGHLAIALAAGAVLYGIYLATDKSARRRLDWPHAAWLLPLLIGIAVISALGNFGGGLGVIPLGWDLLACVVLAIGVFRHAYNCRLPKAQVERYLAEETAAAPEDEALQ
ncbi:MAG: APC family permease [Pseudomonadota bacterium]